MKHALLLFISLFTVFIHHSTAQKSSSEIKNIEFLQEPKLYDHIQISPDGKWMTFLKYGQDISNLYIKSINENIEKVQAITKNIHSEIIEYTWSSNSKAIIFITKEKNKFSLKSILLDTYNLNQSFEYQYVNQLHEKPNIYKLSTIDPLKVFVAYTPPPLQWENLYCIQLNKGNIFPIMINTQSIIDYYMNDKDSLKYLIIEHEQKNSIVQIQEDNTLDTIFTSLENEQLNFIGSHAINQNLLISTTSNDITKVLELDIHQRKVNTSKEFTSSKNLNKFITDQYTNELLGLELHSDTLRYQYYNQFYDSLKSKISTKHPKSDIELIYPNKQQQQHILYSVHSFDTPKSYFLYHHINDSSSFITSILPNTYSRIKNSNKNLSEILNIKNNSADEIKSVLTKDISTKKKRKPLIVVLRPNNINQDISIKFAPYIQYLSDQGYSILQPFINTKNEDSLNFDLHIQGVTEDIYQSIQNAIQKGQIDHKNIYIIGEDIGSYLAFKISEQYPHLFKGVYLQDGFVNIQSKLDVYPENWKNEKEDFIQKIGWIKDSVSTQQAFISNSTIPILFTNSRKNIFINDSELASIFLNPQQGNFLEFTDEEDNAPNSITNALLNEISLSYINSLYLKKYTHPEKLQSYFNQNYSLKKSDTTLSNTDFKVERMPPLRGKLRKNEYTYDVTLHWDGDTKKFQQTRNIKVDTERYMILTYQSDNLGIKTEKYYLNFENTPIYQEIKRDNEQKSYTFTKDKTYIQQHDQILEIPTPRSFLVQGGVFDIVVGNLPLKIGYTFHTYLIDEYSQNYEPFALKVTGEETINYKEAFVVELNHTIEKDNYIKIWIDKRTRLMLKSEQKIPSQGNLVIEKQLVQ